MGYVALIIIAAGIILIQYMYGSNLQTKNDELEQQARTSDARLQDLSQQDQKNFAVVTTQDQKVISDLRAHLADVEARPVISIPPLQVAQQPGPVQVVIPPKPPPPGPKVDPDVLQKQLDLVNSKIAEVRQDLAVAQKDLAGESGSSIPNGDGTYNYVSSAGHGAASQKVSDDQEKLNDLESQKTSLKNQLAQLPTSPNGPSFDPGSMSDQVAH
jgi:hypothetical protein